MTTPDSRAREAAQYLAALTTERDEYKQRMQRLRKERDALKDAARLALDEMENVTYAVLSGATTVDVLNFERTVAALKAVL